jgi:hypothetical protein
MKELFKGAYYYEHPPLFSDPPDSLKRGYGISEKDFYPDV